MTLASDLPLERTAGNGSDAVIDVGFIAYALTDVDVELYDGDNEAVSITRDGGGTYDYAVTGSLNTATDQYESIQVTFNTAPPTGYTIGVSRSTVVQQVLDLAAGGPLPAEDLEITLDKIVAMIQDLLAAIARAPKAPIGVGDIIDFNNTIIVNEGSSGLGTALGDGKWYLSSAQATVADTEATIVFDAEAFNHITRGTFDTGTGIYTAGADGARVLAIAGAVVEAVDAGDYAELLIEMPGATEAYQRRDFNAGASAAAEMTLSASGYACLEAGETVQARIKTEEIESVLAGSARTFIIIIELG